MIIIKFITILFLLLFYKSVYLTGNEIYSKLDYTNFLTRVIYNEAGYSFFFLGSRDTKNSSFDLDFSFESRLIRAGRLKRTGFWKELFNPLGFSASSNLFYESPGLSKDFSLYTGGIYGLSYETNNGLGLDILFTDNLWFGGYYRINIDSFSITAFGATGKYKKTSSDEWISYFEIVPISDPVHFGMHSILEWNELKIDYLGSISGNTKYKAGSFNRIYIESFWDKVRLKGVAGITTPDFISTDLKLIEDKYSLSLRIDTYPYKYLETILKFQYTEEHLPVLPSVFITSSGSSSLKIKYDNTKFLISSEIGQKFDFDSNGSESVENKIDVGVGISKVFTGFINFGFTLDYKSLIERRFECKVDMSSMDTDIEFVYKYKEEIFEPVNQHIFRLRVDRDFGVGVFFLKIEIEKPWLLEGLTIGFNSFFI